MVSGLNSCPDFKRGQIQDGAPGAIPFFLLLFISEKQPDTLDVLSILLPYSTAGSANVNFTIWTSVGCCKWFV